MIRKIEAVDATAEDIKYLLRSVSVGNEICGDVIRAIGNGTAVLWRIEAPKARGVLVTTVSSNALHIWHFAGDGLFRHMHGIVREIQDIAVRNGLSYVTSQSTPVIAKFLFREGFTVPRLVMEWRAPHG